MRGQRGHAISLHMTLCLVRLVRQGPLDPTPVPLVPVRAEPWAYVLPPRVAHGECSQKSSSRYKRCNRFGGARPLVCPVGAVDFVGC